MRAHPVLMLIVAATALRLVLAALLGLGIDESYMVVAGRGPLAWGYFDHPPMSWWMARGMADLAGTEAALVVRLPFIALFALSSALMAQLGARFGGARAGFWAVVAFNLSPVFGLTTGSWVLPDGPLVCSLLGAALCAERALATGAWRAWMGTGLCFGLAMLSKYTAALTGLGLVLYLLATPGQRVWFARPQLYVAGLVAGLVFAPVVVWNAQHGFASLAFQSGRAAAASLHPFGPVLVLAGEALFVLPWIWLGLMREGFATLRGPAGPARLLAFMAAPPIVLFAVVALWSRQVLFHWAAPGYLMLYPALGVFLARWHHAPRAARATAWLLGGVAAAALVAINLPLSLPKDPLLQARSWSGLREVLPDRALSVAALSWSDAGKIGIGLGPEYHVVVLNRDAREFLFRPQPLPGRDVMIVARGRTLAEMQQEYGEFFARITEAGSLVISATRFTVFLGHQVMAWPVL